VARWRLYPGAGPQPAKFPEKWYVNCAGSGYHQHARVVDQQIDGTELPGDFADHDRHLIGIGDVGPNGQGSASRGKDLGNRFCRFSFRGAIIDRHAAPPRLASIY
jgi:hypothetical protein